MWNVFKFIFGFVLIGGVIETRSINVINVLAVLWGVYLMLTSAALFLGKLMPPPPDA